MTRREWSMPAGESSQARAGQSSGASEPSRPWGAAEFVVHFIFCMTFFGFIGFLASSSFPIAIGLFLFFTDDRLIEWVLQKVGIRLVPDTLGPEFIKAFVFLLVVSTLLTCWKDSAPEWLLRWFPSGASWYLIGGTALFCAVLKIVSVAVVRRLLPRVGIELAPDWHSWAILVVLGMLIGLFSLAIFFFAP